MDHAHARTVFGRFVAGASVPQDDLDGALDHAESCDDCSSDYGDHAAVDVEGLFDRALTVSLRTHPDAIARARAADRLGASRRGSRAALAALAEAARGDPEARVRVAALRALDALGGAGGPISRPGGAAPA